MHRHRIRSCSLALIVAWGALAHVWPESGPGGASSPECKPNEVLGDYMQKHHAGGDATVLAYDHRKGTWSAFAWEKAGQDEKPRLLSPLGPQGGFHTASLVPLLRAPEKTRLLVFVVNTNPLLFHVIPVASTERDIEDLAALQALAARLGNLARTAVDMGTAFQDDVSGVKATDPNAPSPPSVGGSSDELKAEQDLYRQRLDEFVPTDEVIKAVEIVVSAFKSWLERDILKLAIVKEKSEGVEAAVAALVRVESEVPIILQHLESGRCLPRLLESVATDSNAPDANSIERSFTELDDSREGPATPTLRCEGTASALAEWIELLFTPEPSGAAEKLARVRRITELAEALSPPRAERDGCGAAADPVMQALSTLREYLIKGEIAEERRKALEVAWVSASRYGEMGAKRAEMDAAVMEILSKKPTAIKSRAGIDFLIEGERASAVGPDDAAKLCALRCAVIPVPREYGERVAVRWSKIRTEGFKIEMDQARTEQVVSTRSAPVEPKYDLAARRTLGFGVNVGLVYTDVRDPEWDAVTDPDDPNGKILERSGESSRSGKFALLAVFEPWQWRDRSEALGLQIGTEAEGDPSAFFAGLNFRFLSVVNVGLGHTWQKLSELSGDLEEGDDIAGSEDIRTRETWDGDLYLSLSISLDELPFFKPAE